MRGVTFVESYIQDGAFGVVIGPRDKFILVFSEDHPQYADVTEGLIESFRELGIPDDRYLILFADAKIAVLKDLLPE